MKKFLSLLSLAALTFGLLGSCSKIDERISNLEKRVDGIEATSIASVQQQIDGIKTSINDLKAADAAINGKIDDLKTAAETQQTLIDALKEADIALGQKDAELEGRIATLEGQVATIGGQIETLVNADKAINTRIDTLSTYVDTQIGKTKDWATETFATLEQYQQTADDLAALSVTVTGISTTLAGVQTSISGLDTKIDGIDTALQEKITDAKTELEGKINDLKTELEDKIADAISTSETSITSWINELLEGYYTVAEVDAKITGLNTVIEAAKGTSKYRIDSLATELTALKTTVDTVKANIRSEYKTAIDEAINKLDGEIRGALKDSILAVNGRAEALDTRVTNLENRVLAVEGNVNKLLAMIQSVSITPAYSDGSVEAEDGILTLKCIVRPAEALNGMVSSLKDSLLIYADSVKVKTKAATSAYMEIKVSEASVLDAAQGAITLKADISKYLPKGADKALTVALKIKNGISDYTTEFVPVYVAPGPVAPEDALKGAFTVNADGMKVYFSKGNLVAAIDATGAPTAWKFAANQYDYLGTGGANKTIGATAGDVDIFGWSASNNGGTSTTDNYGITASKTASDYSGDFYDWGKAIGDGNTWRTLSKDEWTYLFNNHSYKWTSVNGVKGYVIAPDGFSGELSDTYADDAALAANNLVFLPAAGYRNGSNVSQVGDCGYYWSSTAKGTSYAYYVSFNSSNVSNDPNDYRYRYYGSSVRLVTSGVTPKPVVPVTGVTLNKTELSLIAGKSETLVATVQPADATNQNVIWTSDNTAVATVGSTDGKVTAVAEGTATITAIVDGLFTATCTVTVKSLPAGALAGEFTVNADGKKVHFSKGNLYYDGSNWGFEAEQYYFRTYGGKGKCDAGGYNKDSGTTSGHWGLFGWVGASSTTFTTSPGIYGVSTSETSGDYGNVNGEALKDDWGKTIDDKGTWTTLTGGDNGEWKYLFGNHVNVWGSCNGVPGRFIAPDGYEGDATALSTAIRDWESAQAAGIVFLPAAGFRSGSNVSSVGSYGYCWSSTAGNDGYVYLVKFGNDNGGADLEAGRGRGYSVRLITEVK